MTLDDSILFPTNHFFLKPFNLNTFSTDTVETHPSPVESDVKPAQVSTVAVYAT